MPGYQSTQSVVLVVESTLCVLDSLLLQEHDTFYPVPLFLGPGLAVI